MGCGCGLWLRCSLGRLGQESRVSGFGVWLGFDLCLGSGSVRRLRGAGRVGSGVHRVVRPRRVRGGACGPAGGRWPHWESHTEGSTGVPGAYAACRLGSSRRTCRASACPMRTSLRTEGLAASSMRCPGGGEEREDVRGPRRGGEHDVGRVRPRERCWGEQDHRTAVYCEVPSGAMVEEPD